MTRKLNLLSLKVKGMSHLRLLVAALLSLAWCAVSAQIIEEYETSISTTEWPNPIDIEEVLSLSQLRVAVNRFDKLRDPVLIIRYPGGDAGNAWAIELRDVLVSLGIESENILLEFGSGKFDTLLVTVSEKRP